MLKQFKNKLSVKVIASSQKVRQFLKDEKSDNTTTSNGMWIYAALVLGLIILYIGSEATDSSYNGMFNSFQDGTSGTVDEAGLKQWSDKTSGYDRNGQ